MAYNTYEVTTLNIELKKIEDHLFNELIELIHSDNEMKKIFYPNFINRIGLASIAYYILENEKRIGFIALIEEKESYTVDCGIIEAYRNKGIGTTALNLLTNHLKINDKKITIETKISNISANKAILKNKCKLVKTLNNINYYEVSNKSFVKLKK